MTSDLSRWCDAWRKKIAGLQQEILLFMVLLRGEERQEKLPKYPLGRVNHTNLELRPGQRSQGGSTPPHTGSHFPCENEPVPPSLLAVLHPGQWRGAFLARHGNDERGFAR